MYNLILISGVQHNKYLYICIYCKMITTSLVNIHHYSYKIFVFKISVTFKYAIQYYLLESPCRILHPQDFIML